MRHSYISNLDLKNIELLQYHQNNAEKSILNREKHTARYNKNIRLTAKTALPEYIKILNNTCNPSSLFSQNN